MGNEPSRSHNRGSLSHSAAVPVPSGPSVDAVPPGRRAVREVETLEALMRYGADLRNLALQGLDLTQLEVDWDGIDVQEALFLGCTFPSREVEIKLQDRGAIIFPRFAPRPYDPYRVRLYTSAELNTICVWNGVSRSLDTHIYDWYVAKGGYSPDVEEALNQRLHDHAIEDALGDFIGESIETRLNHRLVGIMGGHGKARDSEAYRLSARVAWNLGKDHLIVTGGGPGIMEAGNLGAYLSGEDEGVLDSALLMLSDAPTSEHPEYQQVAVEVCARFPHGRASLSVPTWFYGFEPSNLFSSHIAKYFSNSIREDGLLAICLHGVIFADGSAGTVQEIFMDAAQNHYYNFGYRSPMAFIGRKRYQPSIDVGIYPTLLREAKEYADFLTISDSPNEIATFIRDHPPVPKPA